MQSYIRHTEGVVRGWPDIDSGGGSPRWPGREGCSRRCYGSAQCRCSCRTEDGRIVFPFEAVKVEFLLRVASNAREPETELARYASVKFMAKNSKGKDACVARAGRPR